MTNLTPKRQTECARPGWLQRCVRRLVNEYWANAGRIDVSLNVQETKNGQAQNADNKSNDANPEANKLIKMWGGASYTVPACKLDSDGMKNRNLGKSPHHAENARHCASYPCRLNKPGSLWVSADDRITERDGQRQKTNRNVYDSICELVDSLISLLCVLFGWITHKRVAKPSNSGYATERA